MSDTHPEIKTAVDDLIGAFEAFQERHDRRFAGEQQSIENIETRLNQPGPHHRSRSRPLDRKQSMGRPSFAVASSAWMIRWKSNPW